jgi:hypothetical protein
MAVYDEYIKSQSGPETKPEAPKEEKKAEEKA